MTIQVEERVDRMRGCGWRKPGGIYLMGGVLSEPCCKLPFPLTVCPCCSAGFKPSRGWTWLDADKLFHKPDEKPCIQEMANVDAEPMCPLRFKIGRAGLLWIGEAHYKTPQDFLREAGEAGISRRISTVPKEFKLGETWVLLAHRKGMGAPVNIMATDGMIPAIFAIFKPQAIEYVTRGDETEEELERVVKRGLTPVSVMRESSRRLYL